MIDLRKLEGQINSALGQDVILPQEHSTVETVSTGVASLNVALSGRVADGIALGRVVEVFGPEMSGKTTLALTMLQKAQEEDMPCGFVDMEHSLDVRYAKNIGIDLQNMSVTQPDCGEDAIRIVEEMLHVGYRFIVVDSVAALTPRTELEGSPGDAHMGRLARLMSQAMRKLVPRLTKANAVVVFINQIRANLSPFGSSETTTGGNALKYTASYRIDIRSPRSGKMIVDGVERGIQSKVKVVKNKLYSPYREAKLRIVYGKGIDGAFDLLEYLFRKRDKVTIGDQTYTRKGLAAKLTRNPTLTGKMLAKIC